MKTEVAERLGLLLRNKSEQTKKAYLVCIEKFLQFAGLKDTYDEWDVRRFAEKLDKDGFSASYISLSYWAIKTLFEAQREELNLELKGILPREEEKIQPAMSVKNIRKLIETTKAKGSPKQKALLALSTTFGLRVSEMAALKGEDIDLGERSILIRTKKGGRTRKHLLPDEILPIITSYPFNGDMSASGLNSCFRWICSLAGVKREKREVWHSLRRRLLIELVNARVPEEKIYKFLRWRRRDFQMISVYYNVKDEDVDKEIFQIHPFLGSWR